MRSRWYAIHIQSAHIVAQEIECDVVAELLNAGQPVFLGDRTELQQLALRHSKPLRVQAVVGSRAQKREPSQRSVSDFTAGFDETTCSLLRGQRRGVVSPLASFATQSGDSWPVCRDELLTGKRSSTASTIRSTPLRTAQLS